jgi:DNA relaxase NicK
MVSHPPPPTNRGVEKNMGYPSAEKISERCDWVAATLPFYKDLNWPDFIDLNWKEIRPIRNYNQGQENTQGVKLFWHDTRPSQGKHIIFSGSTLTRLEPHTYDLLKWIGGGGFRVSRIDLCVDVTHSNLNPRNATYHIKKGQCKTHAKSAPKWDDSMQSGYTQYIGKKTSETYIRIYDKQAEMGTDFRWIRAEIVFQGDRATPALNAYLLNQNVRGIIATFCKFPLWRKWSSVMLARVEELHVPPKQTQTRIWLMGQVAKALAKEMAMEDSHEFWLNFVQRVREEYLGITKGDNESEILF